MLEHAQHTALCVGLYLFITDMAMQFRLVKTLDSGFADRLGTAVLHRIKGLGFLFVNTTDVANGMGKVRAQGVVANELWFHVHPR